MKNSFKSLFLGSHVSLQLFATQETSWIADSELAELHYKQGQRREGRFC